MAAPLRAVALLWRWRLMGSPHLPARRDLTCNFFFLKDVFTLAYFTLASSRRSLRQAALVSASMLFLLAFTTPVCKSMDFGRLAREPLVCFVVIMMLSFLPLTTGLMSKTFLLARPLNLKEFRPVRLPGSALNTGMLGLFRTKEELFFTHSQISSGE